LIAVLYRSPYFQASTLTELAACDDFTPSYYRRIRSNSIL